MPPEQFPRHDKKIGFAVILTVVCALALLAFAIFLLTRGQEAVPTTPGGEVVSTPTPTVPSNVSSPNKVTLPEVFADDRTQQERKETLLSLISDPSRELTENEKFYIGQEFGAGRTVLYKFTKEELQMILNALNR